MEHATTALQSLGKAKHWCITVNNYGDADICQFENTQECATYYVYGKEISDSGTRHLQCYIVFKTAKGLTALKKYWPTGHFEHKYEKSTPQQASDYCKKDGDFMEFGLLPEPKHAAGSRAGSGKGGEATKHKWEEIKKLAQQGDLEAIPAQVYVGCYKNLKQIKMDNQPKSSNLKKPCGVWIHGKSGVGKSYYARNKYPDAYIKMMNKWWDGYNGEEVVILEDIDPNYGQSMHYFLKIWADAYAHPAEIKNFKLDNIRPKKFVVTSQYTPDEIWKGADLEAIERRFIKMEITKNPIKEMTKKKIQEDIRKRKAELEKMQEVIKKPKMLKQDANGNIVENKNPVVQTFIDETIQPAGFKFDFTEKSKKPKFEFNEPLDALVETITISDSESDDSCSDSESQSESSGPIDSDEEWSSSSESIY